MLTHRRHLGLAVTEQGLSAVEVEAAPTGRSAVVKTARLAFTTGDNLQQPEKVGKALKQALRHAGISATHCTVGLAGTYLAWREKSVPTADPESLRGVLNIAIEREFALSQQELAFDYFACPQAKGAVAVVAAAPRKVLDQLQAMAAAAGLTVSAVTSSGTSLTMATGGRIPPAGRLVLCLLTDGASLAVQTPSGLRMIRRLNVQADAADLSQRLASEMRRVLALAHGQLEPEPPGDLLVWNIAGAAPASIESLSSLGLRVRICGIEADLGLSAGLGPAFSQAAALGKGFGAPPVIDFVHSRLAVAKRTRLGKPARWAIAAAAALVALGVFMVADYRSTQRDIAALQGQIDRLKEPAQSAKTLIDNVTFAGNWYESRPPFLDCLKEITQAFPDEGKIWATALIVREDMSAMLTGKATSRAATLEVLDRLKANPRLANVKSLYIRQAPGASQEISFAISLNLGAH